MRAENLKRGFTIVELLMVVAIIGILLALSVSAVRGAITKARDKQAEACVALVNQGAEAYYTVKGEWPGSFRMEADSDTDHHVLTATEVRSAIYALVWEAHEGRPPMDISGLYVSRHDPGENNNKNVYGTDFMSAIRGTKKSPKKMSAREMYFGYPESEHGYFRRFEAKYYPKTDRLVFTK